MPFVPSRKNKTLCVEACSSSSETRHPWLKALLNGFASRRIAGCNWFFSRRRYQDQHVRNPDLETMNWRLNAGIEMRIYYRECSASCPIGRRSIDIQGRNRVAIICATTLIIEHVVSLSLSPLPIDARDKKKVSLRTKDSVSLTNRSHALMFLFLYLRLPFFSFSLNKVRHIFVLVDRLLHLLPSPAILFPLKSDERQPTVGKTRQSRDRFY